MQSFLEKNQRIHIIGINGIGVSALAGILHQYGKKISGSDNESSKITEKLAQAGIEITIGHSSSAIKKHPLPDLVIYSLAIPAWNPELKEARRRKIPILSYPLALGELTRKFFTIAVCGTHGKTTITAMIAKILIENNFDPTVIVGTTLKELGGQNFRVGKSKLLVLEACEYKGAFLNYQPRIIVVHTIDPDHFDYYRNFDAYRKAFHTFALRLPRDGYFFGNLDDEDVHEVLKTLQTSKFPSQNTFTYSTKYAESDFYLNGETIIKKNAAIGKLDLKIPGEHNRGNALAAFSVSAVLGIATPDILKSLHQYTGAGRRFEFKGKIGKTLLIDDYAHHPVEIEATLQAAREKFPKEKICVIFQPHQYSRTKKLLKEFAQSFSKADAVVIPNIYESRDTKKDKASVSTDQLVKEIQKYHSHVRSGGGLEKTKEFLKKNAKKFDVILIMGAGDVWKIIDL